ncbi:hypothetical protein FPRO03_14038 [Fusarium proliferatum]|nr:hypothetical protein FPRO03_14038 [Fusarium proliferatum]
MRNLALPAETPCLSRLALKAYKKTSFVVKVCRLRLVSFSTPGGLRAFVEMTSARMVAKEQRRLEEAEEKVEGEFMLLQAESTRIHNEMNAKLAQITRLRRQRRQVESKGLDMLRRGLNSIDELEKAEKDENAAFEQAISEGTFHDWSAIVEQSEWDSLGLGQFIDPPFVVGGSSSGVAEHG